MNNSNNNSSNSGNSNNNSSNSGISSSFKDGIRSINNSFLYISKKFKKEKVRARHNGLLEVNNSKIRQILNDITINKEPFDTNNFLILLSNNYYSKKFGIFPSKKYYIKNKYFPGKIIIDKYTNFNDYSFEFTPTPNQIYIKLPKEQIYVLYSEYEHKLLDSKFNELFDVLTVIGAKYIKVNKIIQSSLSNGVALGTELGLNNCSNAKISNKLSILNEKDSSLLITQEMHFNNEIEIDLNDIQKNNYFYLPHLIDLKNLIARRIEKNLISDKYTYIHSNYNLLSQKAMLKLNKLNIGLNASFDRTFKQISNFQNEYHIEFYDIKSKNMNKIELDEYDYEMSWLSKMVSKFINYNNFNNFSNF